MRYPLAMDPLVERALTAVLEAEPLRQRKVQGVWVFGSRARGDAGAESDVDLAVLCTPALGFERAVVMDRAGNAVGCDVDVIDLRAAPPTLAWEVVTSGRLVVEGDELEVERFVRAARFAAEDAEQRNRMIVL